MSALLSYLGRDSEKWKQRSTVELSSVATDDQDLAGVGSSPYGDMGITGIRVPSAATPDFAHRYLFRLCAIEIPSGTAIRIVGLRQLATIRHFDDTTKLPLEREIESPLWSFSDGNISWHLRLQPEQFSARVDAGQRSGTSPNNRGHSTALLYRQLTPYVPLGGGKPPGNPIQDLGTWRDIRFPWGNNSWDTNILIAAPGTVALYASVHQTDPDTRPAYPDCTGMREEDRFVASFSDAKYGRVAGGLIVELFPEGVVK